MPSILITGAAGFIGYHLQQLWQDKYLVQGIDLLEQATLAVALRSKKIKNINHASIHDNFIDNLPKKPDLLVHLAAETGISGSIHSPNKYLHTNVVGTFNVLEQCRKNGVKHLIYASSSSVYSPNQSVMHENSDTSKQLSFYGTSKKMSEVMIENYCAQFDITAIGLRFFTVYGSYTRPDMAAYKFMQAISQNKKITLYNEGMVMRDFTHVSDVVHAIDLLAEKIQTQTPGTHQLFNIGFGKPISVKNYAESIAKMLEREITFEFKQLPNNELTSTHSNSDKLHNFIGYKPIIPLQIGVKEMTDWFKVTRYE
jgi:UDP-glucuronate 4-epimerase